MRPSPAAPLSLLWLNHRFLIDPAPALLWPDQATAFITDTHFGKEASFQTAGIPVPDSGLQADLDRLSDLISRHSVKNLVILGDFHHNRWSQSPEVVDALRQWRLDHPTLAILLVRGNHDRHAGDPHPDLSIRIVDGPWNYHGITLVHDSDTPAQPAPGEDPPRPVLAGHVHPAVLLRDRAGRGLRLPCFHLSAAGVAMLPAFGTFTGKHTIRPRPGDRVIGVQGGQVVEIPVP